jgi:hypothetical protein
MKKIKLPLLGIATLLMSVFLFISCNEEENKLEKENTKHENLLKLDAKELANIHNDVLIKLYDTDVYYNENSRTNGDITEEQLLNMLMAADLDVSPEVLQNIFDYISNNNDVEANISNIANEFESGELEALYLQLNNDMDNVQSYEEMVRLLANATDEVHSGSYNEIDVKIFDIFVETSIASAEYWYKIDPKNPKTNPKPKKEVPKWVKKDGNAIAQASVGWAVYAGIFGGGPVGYFATLGIAGAIGSVWP